MLSKTLMTVIVAALITLPAAAEQRTAKISNRGNVAIVFSQFKGPIDKVTFGVKDSDVLCSNVTAQYANGDSRSLFYGELKAGTPREVQLQKNSVEKLVFTCHTKTQQAGVLELTTAP
jgi:hypothetical protein